MSLPPDPFPEALERRKARWEDYAGQPYLRLTEDFHGHPKGTLAWDDRVIPGYPRIGRIFRLQQGLAQQFSGPFWMEEKIDGFNIRIFRAGDDILALSRGGYVCPFATDRAPDFIPPALFEAQPDLVLCAELAGPDNPYTQGGPSFVTTDVELFVFDMMRLGTPGFLLQEDKQALCLAYGLPVPRCFGRFEPRDWQTVLGLVEDLDAEGREGAVFKEDIPRATAPSMSPPGPGSMTLPSGRTTPWSYRGISLPAASCAWRSTWTRRVASRISAWSGNSARPFWRD